MIATTLRRTGIDSLDEALYAASCFAGSAPDQTVTVMMMIGRDRKEHYSIEDGAAGPQRDNKTGTDWRPVYRLTHVSA